MTRKNNIVFASLLCMVCAYQITTHSQAISAQEIMAIKSSLSMLKADVDSAVIEPSEVPGISAVTMGLQVLYITNDGGHIFGGPLIDANNGDNLTNSIVSAARKKRLDKADDVALFQYASSDPDFRVTVITDIDCPHCRRLHNEIPNLQESGVEVNYVMLPRAGKNSPSYKKTVSAACSDQPESAITAAMAGKPTPPKQCDHFIDRHMQLARDLNITSTPAIVFEDGHLELGYKSADKLVELLNEHFSQ